MTRISETFSTLKHRNEAALIPYITLGWPSMKQSIDLAEAICNAGADLIELGVPYSDPIADGPTIREAAWQAMEQGVNVASCLEAVSEIRARGITTPVLLMGYINPFLSYGFNEFTTDAQRAGVDGLIIPDLIPESADFLISDIEESDLDWITFVAPTTASHRVKRIEKSGSGFIYCISLIGITGARETLPTQVDEYIRSIKEQLSLPIAVGFGISTPQHVASISQIADGVIIGSALMNIIRNNENGDGIFVAENFIRDCKKATLRNNVGESLCNTH